MGTPSLVVLAAGIGSRYGGFKQIEPLGPNGEVGIDYAVYDAWRAGFGKVVFVTRPELEEPLREHFASNLRGRMEVAFAFQGLADLPPGFTVPSGRQKPWGTGHAVWAARHAVDGPFAVINADDYYGPNSYRVLGELLSGGASPGGGTATYAMVAFVLRNTLSEHGTVSRGICSTTCDGYLTHVVERTKIRPAPGGAAEFLDDAGAWQPLTGDEPASMNMWGFDPSLFGHFESMFTAFLRERSGDPKAEFYLPSMVDELVRNGSCRTRVLRTDDQWFGITYPEDRPHVEASIKALVASGVYPGDLWA